MKTGAICSSKRKHVPLNWALTNSQQPTYPNLQQ